MTQDEIIRMAREAGFTDASTTDVWITDGYWTKELERFAALVAEHEREACAKVCDELKWRSPPLNFAENCAAVIRSRSSEH